MTVKCARGVKYTSLKKHGKKRVGVMYEDTDFGKDNLAGAVDQIKAMGLQAGATAGFRPTDTDFNAHVARLQDDKCDLVMMGTIVKDTVLILETAHKTSFNATFCGNFASYSTAVAEVPGEPAEGFYSMAPALYRYPRQSRSEDPCVLHGIQSALGIRGELSRRSRTRCGDLYGRFAGADR